MAETTALIRPYRPADHDAVYDVCVRTADAGGDARGLYHSDDLMPDLFAGPYLHLGVHVTVAKANTGAIGFYRRLGFRPLELAEPGETTVTCLGRGL